MNFQKNCIFAIANKDLLIAGGRILVDEILASNNLICPLDSEHFSLIDLSLKWILSYPEITVVIPGAKNKIQAELNVKASELNEINSLKDSIKEIYNKYFKKDIHSKW